MIVLHKHNYIRLWHESSRMACADAKYETTNAFGITRQIFSETWTSVHKFGRVASLPLLLCSGLV